MHSQLLASLFFKVILKFISFSLKDFFIDECAMCLVVIENPIPVAFFVLFVCIGFFIF